MRDFLERLADRRRFGVRPGLETMRALCEALGHPERELAVIHVAGTNGKGSVTALCEAALRTMGLRVGRYTSPHLVRVNERFLVDGTEASDAALAEALDEVEAACARIGAEPTFFEALTACAFALFRRAGVRLAVMEVGMGGRWDATNVIEAPLVAVITRVALDHCAILGDSLEAIAAEKAGILKPGRPAVIGAMDPRARAVIAARAAALGAPLHDAAQEIRVAASRRTVHGQTLTCESPNGAYPAALTRLAGTFQAENAATALCALERLGEQGLEVPPKAFAEALRTVAWPGRCQLIAEDPPTFLDGGHNPDALRALREALRSMHVRRRVALVCGFCADKAVGEALREIAPLASAAWAVPLANPRGMAPADLAGLLRDAGVPTALVAGSATDGLAAATAWAQDNQGTVVVCGSLFLAGEILAAEEGLGAPDPSEAMRAH